MTLSMEDLLQTLSLGPVTEGIIAALNVPMLTDLAPGGVWTDIPQGTSYPAVLVDVDESEQLGGFGTKPGLGMVPKIALRFHVYSQYAGWDEARRVMSVVKYLLRDKDCLSIDGWSAREIVWYDTHSEPDEVLAGQKVKELTANAGLFVEAA